MGSKHITISGSMVRERTTLEIIRAKMATVEVRRPLWQRAVLCVLSPWTVLFLLCGAAGTVGAYLIGA